MHSYSCSLSDHSFSHLLMLLNLLFLLLIVLHDFQPLSLHQTTFLNVELFLRLCKRRFIKSVVTITKATRLTGRRASVTFASISSTFSLASCSIKAIMCLICHKKHKKQLVQVHISDNVHPLSVFSVCFLNDT